MATVGNLFVNVGANTHGLEKGLKKAQHSVNGFTHNLEAMGKTEGGEKVLGKLEMISAIFQETDWGCRRIKECASWYCGNASEASRNH